MNIVQVKNLQKSFGKTHILQDVSLSVNAGDFMVVLGTPSSGKSVLVRLLTGLDMPDAGAISLRGNDITSWSAGQRNIGYVPQSFALFPNMTVFKNIAYPLSINGVKEEDTRPTVERMAGLLGIAELLDRKPSQLSGGQKQRVAIARGLVKDTDLFVLDDPLVGLDFKLRERLIEDLKQAQKTLGVTFIYVTSDAVEALLLASKVAVLHEGSIVESGCPEDLYHSPQTAETMRYLGFPQANFAKASLQEENGRWQLRTQLFPDDLEVAVGLSAEQKASTSTAEIVLGIRPEDIHFGEPLAETELACNAKIYLREDLGGEEIVYLETPFMQLVTVLRNEHKALLQANIGEEITFHIDPTNVVVFADGQLIGRGLSQEK